MKLSTNLLSELETLVSSGELGKAIEKLLEVKDQTGYKNEILSINGRWKKYSLDSIKGTLSEEQDFLQNSKMNDDFLTLINGLRKELAGEKVNPDLFPSVPTYQKQNPFLKTYLPMLLTAIGVAAICFFAFKAPEEYCEESIEIAGDWDVIGHHDGKDMPMGSVTIVMEKCSPYFRISGKVFQSMDTTVEVDFSSKIAGINNGEIYFVYENFAGERGVCRGVVADNVEKEFTVHCIDLIGLDKNNQSNMNIKFRKKE